MTKHSWARTARGLAAAGAALTVSLVAGCSGGATTAPSQAPASSGAAATGTITVWHYFSAPNQVQLMDKYGQMFEASHPGSKVQNVYVPYDQMNSKLVAATGAGSGPDVAVFNGAEYGTLAAGGVLQPMDSMLSGFADKGQLPDSVVHKLDNKTYAVQGYVNLLGLWYNQDILTELGLQPPTTLAELETDMAAAKAKGYTGMTLCGLPQGQGEWQAYPWLSAKGFTYGAADQTKLADGLALVRGWVDKGYVPQESVTWDQTVPFQKFAAGKVLFAENGNWQMGTAKTDAKFNYGVVQLPIGNSGKVYLGGEGEGIGANSKNAQLAWEYIASTYLSKEGQLAAASLVGSIPSRADLGSDPAIIGDRLLKPFAQTVAANGTNYPASNIDPKSVPDLQLTIGQAWSAVIGKQSDPTAAAQQAFAKIKPLLR
jgi:multiple sugar transport system substrate-binding protein